MKMRETLIDGDPERYEQRYTVDQCRVPQHFVRRPISIVPPEGTLCFVDDGPRHGDIARYTAGHFADGKWRKVKFEPTHWTIWE